MRLSLVSLLMRRLDKHFLQHLHGPALLRFFTKINELGVEQLQEDRAELSSVQSMDVSELMASSEQIKPDEDLH